jgi:hypothetical protein
MSSVNSESLHSITVTRIVVVSLLALSSAAASEAQDRFDPKILADLPDNTTVNLTVPFVGGEYIPAVFDEARGSFFQYGGWRDRSPQVNLEGSKFPKETYGNSAWVLDMKAGQWKMLRPFDFSFPTDRPPTGYFRGLAYDSKRKVIWLYGAKGGVRGGDPADLWTYDSADDKFTKRDSTNRPPRGTESESDAIVYDSVRDLIVLPRGKVTWIYRPTQNAWEKRETPEAPVPDQRSCMVFDAASKRILFPKAVATGKKADRLDEGQAPSRWRPLASGGFDEFSFQTWAYDPDANKWTDLKPSNSPDPEYRLLFGLAYDSKNKVAILMGGRSFAFGSFQKKEVDPYLDDIWVFDSTKNSWSKMDYAGPRFRTYHDGCQAMAYDPTNNVVIFTNIRSRIAYRYKK